MLLSRQMWLSQFDLQLAQKAVAVVDHAEISACSPFVHRGIPAGAFRNFLDVPVEKEYHMVHYYMDNVVAELDLVLADHMEKPNTNPVESDEGNIEHAQDAEVVGAWYLETRQELY